MNRLDLEKERTAKEKIDDNCCEECGKELDPIGADSSIHLSYNWIGGPKVLCEKHLDKLSRHQYKERW